MSNFIKLVGAIGIGIGVFAAQAGAVQHSVSLSATVAPSCSISGAPTFSGVGFTGASLASSTFGATITNGVAVASVGILTFPTVSCNGGNIKVTVNPSATAIVTAGTPGANQVAKIDYKAQALLNPAGSQIAGIDTSLGTASDSGNSGVSAAAIDLKITILPTPAGKNLLAGSYAGTLKIDFDIN